MFKKISDKNKLYLLLAGLIISLFVVYKIAIQSTINLASQCKELNDKLSQVKDAPERIAELEAEISKYTDILSSETPELNMGEVLLDAISRYCQENTLVLKEFPEDHVYNRNNYTINTSIITIEGGFIKMLKLLYMLETNKTYGKISSAGFYTYLDKKTKKYELNLKIYVQNIRHITE